MMAWIAGVDGCKAGWIAALCDSDFRNPPAIKVFGDFASILNDDCAPSIVAVDMPIGLPDWIEGRGRGPEDAARAVLGRRSGSVFSIPSRAAVYAVDRAVVGMADIATSHAMACGIARATSTLKAAFSRQAFMILPKIREIDRVLQAMPERRSRVREIHPEIAFWSMNDGKPLQFGKKYPAGEAERVELLRRQGLKEEWALSIPPKGARRDDQIDALAALVVARHIAAGRGITFPKIAERDRHSIEVAIWSFADR